MQGLGLAITIEATVPGAESAAFKQSRMKLPTRPVQANVQVGSGDAQPIRGGRHGFLFEVHRAYQVGVIGFEGGQQRLEAGAQRSPVLLRRRLVQLLLKLHERTFTDRPTPIQVNQGMTENPVEPGHQILVISDLFAVLQRLQEAVLKQVGGELGIGHPLAHEGQERFPVLEQMLRELLRRHHGLTMCDWVRLSTGQWQALPCLLNCQ